MPVSRTQGDGMATPHLLAHFTGAPVRTRSPRKGRPGAPGGQPHCPRCNPAMTTSLTTPTHSPTDSPTDSLAEVSTTDLSAITATADPWAGLTEDDATRIAAALAATHAASTRKVYAFAWRRWVRWCAGRRIGSTSAWRPSASSRGSRPRSPRPPHRRSDVPPRGAGHRRGLRADQPRTDAATWPRSSCGSPAGQRPRCSCRLRPPPTRFDTATPTPARTNAAAPTAATSRVRRR